jgi:hypothetical protein
VHLRRRQQPFTFIIMVRRVSSSAERQGEALITTAAEQGVALEQRAGVAPEAVLGVESRWEAEHHRHRPVAVAAEATVAATGVECASDILTRGGRVPSVNCAIGAGNVAALDARGVNASSSFQPFLGGGALGAPGPISPPGRPWRAVLRLSLRFPLMCFGPARKSFVSFCHAYHHALGLEIDHFLSHRSRLFGARPEIVRIIDRKFAHAGRVSYATWVWPSVINYSRGLRPPAASLGCPAPQTRGCRSPCAARWCVFRGLSCKEAAE